EPGTLLFADLTQPAYEPDQTLRMASGREGTTVTISEDTLSWAGHRLRWREEIQSRRMRVACLTGREVLDPTAWLRPFLGLVGETRLLYWLRVTQREEGTARAIAAARAIELSCPTVIEAETEAPIVIERSTRYKDVSASA